LIVYTWAFGLADDLFFAALRLCGKRFLSIFTTLEVIFPAKTQRRKEGAKQAETKEKTADGFL
jgi:hypothetical protein